MQRGGAWLNGPGFLIPHRSPYHVRGVDEGWVMGGGEESKRRSGRENCGGNAR